MELKLDIYLTVTLAIGVFYLGQFLKAKVGVFQKYCIPAPVIGGVIFALAALALRSSGLLMFTFDTTLQGVFMNIFFTSVGFTASFKLLKKGGLQVFIFLGIVIVLVILQNILASGLGVMFGLDPRLGLAAGSIPMVGGHGTSASFGPLLEDMGITGANTVAIAASTFGLVMGGIIGGPIARRLIKKYDLKPEFDENGVAYGSVEEPHFQINDKITQVGFMTAAAQIFIAMGIGSILFNIFKSWNITLPTYIGAMLIAAFIRNLSDGTHWFDIPEKEIQVTGDVCLSLFLSMALMTLKLWELAALALPLITILIAQTILMALYANFVTFPIMGKNYDAAVMASANCGFGMGATPNAIANMQAITTVFGPSPKAYFIVPLVGGLFIDFFNGGIITLFINVFSR